MQLPCSSGSKTHVPSSQVSTCLYEKSACACVAQGWWVNATGWIFDGSVTWRLSRRLRACATNVSGLSSVVEMAPPSRSSDHVLRSNRLTRSSSYDITTKTTPVLPNSDKKNDALWASARAHGYQELQNACVTTFLEGCATRGHYLPEDSESRLPVGQVAGRRFCGRDPAAGRWLSTPAPGRALRCGLAAALRLRIHQKHGVRSPPERTTASMRLQPVQPEARRLLGTAYAGRQTASTR